MTVTCPVHPSVTSVEETGDDVRSRVRHASSQTTEGVYDHLDRVVLRGAIVSCWRPRRSGTTQ
ncbi:hypothetical protein DVK05_05895 [Halorubrum sp. Atlit-8R]|nr:hypothetical protein DVK08_12920 [Halorubrum sp. Atlit-9R]RLM81594.1 hypothetical protein DVK05_05895 [Halorubrum sp. Atlit-8R]